ncbi:MAG: hypothetical protein ACK4Z5_04105 [Brevundimonas sp.]
MERHLFVRRIADRLKAAERSTDANIAAVAELIREMTSERAAAGFAAHAGHKALVNCISALGQLSETRARLIQAHDRLATDAEAFGIPTSAMGPLEDKDARPTTGLKGVAAAA